MPTEEDKVTRKLRAILSADVKGYSLLMANDETFTVKTLKSYRKVMSAQIVRHTGRVVDAPGDNLMAEFASVVDAVQCAVEIQKILQEKNEALPVDKRLEFRIGVNIGDVIQDGGNLYGEGVNIAARIEGLADAGGVCISRNAYDHITNKLNYGYEYLGEHSVKNIEKPVRVYKVLMADEDAGKLIGDVPKPVVKNWIWATIVVAAVVITAVGTLVYQKISEPDFEPANVEMMAYPLPDKPSIAVLSFDNLSGYPDEEYLGDGLAEDIITALSKSSEIFVVARNSTFAYKGVPSNIRKIAQELGVRYVLEGSFRKEGNKVRINAQLIDAVKGYHIWGNSYDKDLENIFFIQDEITKQIISSLHVKLTMGEDARIVEKETANLKAYLLYLESRELHLRFSKDDNHQARKILEEIITLDPEYGSAYSLLAATHMVDVFIQATDSPQQSLMKAINLAAKARDYWDGSHDLLGFLYSLVGKYDNALVRM